MVILAVSYPCRQEQPPLGMASDCRAGDNSFQAGNNFTITIV